MGDYYCPQCKSETEPVGSVDILERLAAANAEIERLKAIVARLPVYADTGQPFVPIRDQVWCSGEAEEMSEFIGWNGGDWFAVGDDTPIYWDLYATPEAAQSSAKGEKP